MRKSTLQFCEDEITLGGGAFRREDWPLMVEILDTMDRRRGCVFLIKGSIQSWKSLAAQLKVTADKVLRPCRMAWYGPTRDFVRGFAEEKLNNLYDNTRILRRIEPADSNRIKAMSKNLPHMLFTLLSAHTDVDRQSKSLQSIVCDEAWMYGTGELTEIRGRYTSFESSEDWQFVIPTSGEDKGSDVNEIWEDSDQRAWHVRCESCGHWYYPDVYPPAAIESIDEESGKPIITQPAGGLHFDASDAVRSDTGRIVQRLFDATVYYECPNPACRCHVKELPLSTSKFVSLQPEPASRNVIGWVWNALCHMPMTSVALLKAKADDALAHGDAAELEDFDRKRALRPWSVASVIKTAARPSNLGNYKLGEDWAPEYFREMEIDVQQDHYYWRVRLWSRSTQSRLLALGIAWSEEQLVEAQRKWRVHGHGGVLAEHPKTGQIYFPNGCGVFIDGNYDTARVRRLAARNHWCVLRGEPSGDRYPHPDGRSRIWNPIQAIEAFSGIADPTTTAPATGEAAPPAVAADRYVAEVRFRKAEARNTLRILQNQTSPAEVWTYARDTPDKHPDYLKHLAAWSPRDKIKKKGSLETVTEWVQTHERDDWEWCECAGVIAASMTGLIGSDAVEG